MPRLDNIDELVVRTVLDDRGVVKGFDTIGKKQERFVKNNERMEKSVAKTEKSITGLGKAFRFFGAYLGLKQLAKYSDEWTNIKSTLSLVTENDKERVAVQEKLFQISQNTRQNVGATADLYRRIAISTESMGLSEERRLKVVESINKALIIGGGSSESNKAALVQLGQGLASGQVRGEELNSILEQSPRLAQMIAEGMGIKVGQLREAGKKGLITAEKVIKAIESESIKVNSEFSKMAPTIAQSFVVLDNAIGNFVHNADSGIGVAKLISKAIMTIANNIEQMIVLIGSAFIPKIVRAVPLLSRFFRALKTGVGVVNALRIAWNMSLPAMRAWTASAWAMSAPFVKLVAFVELTLQLIKMLKGEWNWYAEAIDQIERKMFKYMQERDIKKGITPQSQFRGIFSQGVIAPPDVNTQNSDNSVKNVTINNNYNITSTSPQSTAMAIDNRTRNNLKLAGVN